MLAVSCCMGVNVAHHSDSIKMLGVSNIFQDAVEPIFDACANAPLMS